jgi:tellurite resistance protein TerC
LRITNTLYGQHFIVHLREPNTGKLNFYATPLLVALFLIEFVDLIFAVDSVPAILMITLDPYIVYTSNIFAILGLRALYFTLAAMVDRFTYLKNALACVLIFIGSKILIADGLGWEKFPASISFGITFGLIMAGILFSLFKTRMKV